MKQPKDERNYNFDGLFLRRFWRFHKVLFPGLFSLNSGIFVLLLLLCGLEQYLAYEVGLIAGQFFKVLGDKDLDSFPMLCVKSIGIIVGIAFTKSARVLTTKLLVVGWRQVTVLGPLVAHRPGDL